MRIDYSQFAISKGPALALQRAAKRLKRASDERICRQAVHRRDSGRCVVPKCRNRSRHLHHIMYRSRGGKWITSNICSLCVEHHQQVHGALLQIRGNADKRLTITWSAKSHEAPA